MSKREGDWDQIIGPKKNVLSLNLKEVWRYKDLLFMFVKRDFVTVYKQTVLGPLWFFIQPIFTTLIYTVIFGKMAEIPTDGLPKVLFYMAGMVCWGYFAECFNKTSTVFSVNQNIFGKVYFPRLISPLSIIISNLLKFAIQLLLFFAILSYYKIFTTVDLSFSWHVFLFPLLVVLMALMSLGLGMLISSLTTKYKDLKFLLQFGIQLLMYATPIIYPLSYTREEYRWISVLNPMTTIIETFKKGFLGVGSFEWYYLLYTAVFSVVIFVLGTLIFNKTEKDFMDTI